jgi:hypothetical protein
MNPDPFRPGGMPPGGQPRPRPMPRPDDALFSVEVVIMLAVVLFVFLLLSLIVAVQAKRRGYPVLAWLIAGTLANPIFLLVMLGIMPDFRRKKLRKKETDDMERRLARRPNQPEPVPPEVSQTPGAPPGAVRRSLDRSLGDQPTQWPQRERSLGDDETRL